MLEKINDLLKDEFNNLKKNSTYNISDCGPPWLGATISHIIHCINVSHYGYKMGISHNSNWLMSKDGKFNSVFNNTLEEINDNNFIYNDFNIHNTKISYNTERSRLDQLWTSNIFNKKYYPKILKQLNLNDQTLSDIWKSYILKKFFILSDYYENITNERIKRLGLNDDYIVIHIRRGDKIAGMLKEGNYIPVEDYFNLVEKNKTIFLMSDNQDVIYESIQKYKDLKIIYDDLEIRHDGFPLKVYEGKINNHNDFHEELICGLKNLKIISKSKLLIGSPSSWFFRIGQLLMDYDKIQNVKYAEDLNNIQYWPDKYQHC